MDFLSDEKSPLDDRTEDFPEMCSAGQFEHVAHMNMFESHSATLSIPVKLRFIELFGDNIGSTGQGLADKNSNEKGQEDSLSRKEDECSKFLEDVKLDLQVNGSEKRSEQENPTCSRSSAKKVLKTSVNKKVRKVSSRKSKKSESTRNSEEEEETEWEKARAKIEEFLDLPAVISALALRKTADSDSRSRKTNAAAHDDKVLQCESAPVPNSRHNALFLRGSEKSLHLLQLTLRSPDAERTCPLATSPSTECPHENGSPIRSVNAEEPLSTTIKVPLEGQNSHLNGLQGSPGASL